MKPKQNFHSKGFAKIDKLITQAAKEYKLENALYRHQALKNWHAVAASFVDQAVELTRAIDLKKGVLTVACLSRETASMVKLLAQRIIYALNQLLGHNVVYAIYVEV